MRASCLALALAGCLPSSADLGQYSADWSPPPPELEQQMALPNQATGSDPSQQPSGSANSDGTSSTASGDSSSSAPAEPGSSSEQLPTTIVQQPREQGGSGSSTGEPAASEPPSSEPAPTDPTTPQTPAQQQCSDGVLDAAQTSCYLVATVRATWQVARGDCTAWGGSLVKVETPAEDQLMAQLVTEDMWLGASDTAAENVFVWTDGSPILFGNWGPSQPDRFPGPDCVQKRSTDGRQWYDQPCDNQWLYVCEKPITPQ